MTRKISGVPPALLAAFLIAAVTSLIFPGVASAQGSGILRGHGLLVDALGDTIPPGPHPMTIISLSPNLTEILFAAGVVPERIVGVTRYCDYPPEAKGLPRIGGIVDPSLEEIQMRRPDIVLASRGNPVELLERIRALGIPVFAVDDRTGLEGLRAIVAKITALVGPDDMRATDRLVSRFWKEPHAYEAWADSIPPGRRPRVYYVDPEHPEWTAGPGSHVDDLIRHAGGLNLVTEGGAWPQYAAERLVLEQPDWILVALPSGQEKETVRSRLLELPGWNRLTALKTGRVCWIDAGPLLRPGPRLLDALEQLAACLHPDRRRPGPFRP